jgi:hypothetical protein
VAQFAYFLGSAYDGCRPAVAEYDLILSKSALIPSRSYGSATGTAFDCCSSASRFGGFAA